MGPGPELHADLTTFIVPSLMLHQPLYSPCSLPNMASLSHSQAWVQGFLSVCLSLPAPHG